MKKFSRWFVFAKAMRGKILLLSSHDDVLYVIYENLTKCMAKGKFFMEIQVCEKPLFVPD